MSEKALRAVCGATTQGGTPCTKYAFDASGKCWGHSEATKEKRVRYASMGGKRGGPGKRGLRAARREIRGLKKAVAHMTRVSTLGIHADLRPGAQDAIDRTVSLARAYIRLCELEMKLGQTDEEARKDAPDRLTAPELGAALEGDPHDEG